MGHQDARGPVTTPARAGRRWWMVSVVVAAAMVVVVLQATLPGHLPPGLFLGIGRSPTRAATHAPSHGPQAISAHLTLCSPSVAWSPNGTRLAVLGYQGYCPGGGVGYQRAWIDIYDVATGKLLNRLDPDTPILTSLTNPTPPPAGSCAALAAKPVLDYRGLLWSPDSLRLVLPFDATVSLHGSLCTGPVPSPWLGLLVLGILGQSTSYTVAPASAATLSQPYSWAVPPTPSSPSRGCAAAINPTPPAAQSYRWGRDNALTPAAALGADAAPETGPVGNPDGGARFSIWQPGVLETLVTADHTAVASYLVPRFAALSPDGACGVDTLPGQVRLVVPGAPPVSSAMLETVGIGGVPVAPNRDAGLRAALLVEIAATHAGPSTNPAAVMTLAWRPDGQVLAAFGPYVPAPGPAPTVVTFYDCGTGRRLGALPVSAAFTIAQRAPQLAWSPDGTRLLLADAAGDIAIWGGGQLPTE